MQLSFHLSRLFVLFVLASAPLAVAQEKASRAELEALEGRAVQEAAALVAPSVVRVQTVGGLDRVGRILTGTGPTTGVVVSADGYIISSAFNFASKPASVLVTVNEVRYPAKVVATDRAKMLTLLKVDAKDLTPAKAASKEKMRVGEWAIALGKTYDSPFPNVSLGIVSQLNRIWGKAIQTDCKVSPANYGGPLVDIEGNVLGILVPLSSRASGETAGVEWYDSGIGFAIPLEDVYASLERLKKGEDLKPGLMGITFKGRDLYGIKPVIDRVRVNSPAEKAGFKSGDEIVEVDGKKVVRQAQVRHALGNKYAEDSIEVVVKRDDKEIRAELQLAAELPPYQSAYLGILPVRPPVAGAAEKGVGVRFVFPNSPAAKVGLKTFDRIIKFNGTDVGTAAELTDLVSRELTDAKAQLTYVRDGKEKQVEVDLAPLPGVVPAELRSTAIPFSKEKKADDAPKTGRFTETMEAHEHDFWAYVPENYNPEHNYGLMVWIHPNGDTMEAAMFQAWKLLCNQRGIILLAPKAKNVAGWRPDEAEFVKDAVEQFTETYSIDPARVFLHGFSEGGQFAYQLAFKYREMFRGVCGASAPMRARPEENHPDFRLQFHLVCGDKDPAFRLVQRTVTGLKGLKYPVSFRAIPAHADKYPNEAAIEEIARWADCLDRI
jgi:serine protease Do